MIFSKKFSDPDMIILTAKAPNLGIRGVGVTAAGIGGGLEEAPILGFKVRAWLRC